MRKAIVMLGMAATVLAVSCNKEEARVNGETSLTGNKAYLVVNIHDAGASAATRASERAGDPGPFEYGTAEEYAVNDAHFYFYDSEGVFVSEAQVWDKTGTASETTTPKSNVEFKSNTVIVLNNLTSKTYPNWVVTVLNKPADFKAPEFLKDFPSTLADASGEGISKKVEETSYFTMSTTSYYAEDRATYYFATPLKSDNFSLEPVDKTYEAYVGESAPSPVDIYVERLAVKVGLAASLTPADGASSVDVKDANGSETVYTGPLYAIEATVAGDKNEEEPQIQKTFSTPHIGDETLYVGLLGWTLNATARNSNISKVIDYSTWGAGDTNLGFAWNDSSNFRSYWGKSFNYGQSGATSALRAEQASPNTDNEEKSNQTWLNDYLKYTSLNETESRKLSAIGTTGGTNAVEYCAENTNSADVLGGKDSPAITSVLVKALVCHKDGEVYKVANLVRYHGVLYEQTQFLEYVIDELKATTDLGKAWYAVSGVKSPGVRNGETYKPIDASCVELKNVSDGKVDVVLKSEYSETTFYNKSGEEIQKQENATVDVAAILKTFCTADAYDAIGYKDGLMYYNIPIEHLRNNENNAQGIQEANYGVVRNHYYKLTIKQLENVGKGIFDPAEVIVPSKDDEFYYVGADINILSWHVVEQNISL